MTKIRKVMKTNKLMLSATAFLLLLAGVGCGNRTTKAESAVAAAEAAVGEAFYEKLTRRPVLGAMTRLHYNPGRWWTWFSDLFAVGLVAIVASGLLLLKGPKGLRGRGGVELAAGIAVPLLFLIFF